MKICLIKIGNNKNGDKEKNKLHQKENAISPVIFLNTRSKRILIDSYN